jgi:hypothetical protein
LVLVLVMAAALSVFGCFVGQNDVCFSWMQPSVSYTNSANGTAGRGDTVNG